MIERLKSDSLTRFIGVHDGISARLAEKSGAEALWSSGLLISASKGLPDNETVTYETLVRRLEDIRRGTTLPLLADGNTGFGGDQVIGHVVRMLESRGVNGVSLEDKAFPRRNSFDTTVDAYPLEDPEVYARKFALAAAARTSDDFVLVARTEGLIAGETPEQVLDRARLYRQAGADAIIVHSKSDTEDEIVEFARAWRRAAPVIVIPTTYPTLSFSAAREAGVSGVICANQVMRATMRATDEYLAQLVKADSIAECDTELAPLSELLGLFAEPAPGRR
ncbi:isocitrate lyase/phosphoenolpyruvate mutase family protein [Streptomyces sp. CA-111067]|uniref:isocitrate lyase/phosphoenolpyruvate mutase family protein n=1 Tax=Streptomyces sp. CA-111067 TaxID=3240046 RepID=UPI003D99C380